MEDFEITRYAGYSILHNSNLNKPMVTLDQTYFAEQNHPSAARAWKLLAEQWTAQSEDQNWLVIINGQKVTIPYCK